MPKFARKRQEQLAKKRKKRDKLKKARILASKNAMKNHVVNESMANYLINNPPAECEQYDATFGSLSKKDLAAKVRGIVGDQADLIDPPKEYNHQKLSEILLNYISEDVGGLPDDFVLARKIVNFIVCAWNSELCLPNTISDRDLESTLYNNDTEFQQMDDNLKKSFFELVKKKRLRHPDDNRFIVEFHLDNTPQGYNLNVASIMRESDV